MNRDEWEETKSKIEQMKKDSMEYLEFAEATFMKGGNVEIAIGYQHCKGMIEHVHPLLLDYAKKINQAEIIDLWCPKCRDKREMRYDGNYECSECGYRFSGNPPSMIRGNK